MNKKIFIILLLSVLVLPALTFAQLKTDYCGGSTGTPCVDSIETLMAYIENTTAMIFGVVAVIMFVVAGVSFLTAGGEPEKIQKARSAFIWGVAGVLVGIIAFSIIAIVGSLIV